MSQTIIPALEEAAIGQLRDSVRGQILTPDSAGYDDAARIWNGAYDGRRPAVIVSCTGAADVIAALGFARANRLEIAVRGGGHSIAGFSTGDGVMVIDLSPMNAVRVDATARWATVGGGAVWADVDHETLAHGLATTGGLVSSTGVAGFTLGGGIGWLMRKHGLTIDHLRSADVVTADGRVVRASAEENPDLFWALQGGGGNFGIVTAFELGLVPMGPKVFGGVAIYPADQSGAILRAYRNWAAHAPDEVTTILIFRRAPAGWGPSDLQGQPVLGVGALYCGPATEGAAALAPLERLGSPVGSTFQVRSWVGHQSMLDASSPAGRLYYWKSHYLPGLPDAAIDVIAEQAWRFSSPISYTLLSHMGGAIRERNEEDSAFSGREAEFAININCVATQTDSFNADREWVRNWFEAMEPHSTGGVYVNFVGEEGPARVRAAYGEIKYQRLAEVKARFDPENVFRVNQNIAPGGRPVAS